VGSLKFTRADDGRTSTFDSSPQYSLHKMHGWDGATMQLVETDRNPREITFDVLATSDPENSRPAKVGVLVQTTKEEIWKRQAGTSSR
jgi:carbohydrate-selective porin OprB